jgi:hypothetical protein
MHGQFASFLGQFYPALGLVNDCTLPEHLCPIIKVVALRGRERWDLEQANLLLLVEQNVFDRISHFNYF